MRIIIIPYAFIISIVLWPILHSPAHSAEDVVVEAETANVRSGAGGNYGVLSKVSKGTRLTLLEEAAGWYKVALPGGQVGWIWGEMVSRVKPKPDSAAGIRSASVKAPNVNVRAGAGSAYEAIAKLDQGTALSVLEAVGEWYRVRLLDGRTGWVWGEFISVSAPDEAKGAPEFERAREVTVKASLANIRSGLNSGEVVGQVKEGAKLVVRGQEGSWYRVELPDGKVGWISGSLVAAISAPATSGRTEVGEATVKAGMANIRSGPGSENQAIDRAEKGTKLVILAQSGDWYQVRLPNGKTGWISGNVIEITSRGDRAVASAPPKGGTLFVRSQPPGAKVYLNGTLIGETPLELGGLAAGKHELKMEKSGYQTWTSLVAVEAGKAATADATLVESLGSLIVSSQPSEARVYINDIFIATTPVEITNIKPGGYRLKVTKEGYKDWSREVSVKGGERPTLEVKLEEYKGKLSVLSAPQGATVYLEGKQVGVTPLKALTISPGAYKLRLTLEGYHDWESGVSATGDETVEINATLERIKFKLTLSSAPSGASAYLGDELIGTTPLEVDLPPPGRYEVGLIMEGFKKWTQEIVVSGTNPISLEATLVEPRGKLSVSSDPPGASVYLNDEVSGTTPVDELSLPVGIYRLKVSKEGHQPWNGEAIIGDGGVFQVSIVLEKVTQEKVPLLPVPEEGGETAGFVSLSSDPLGADVYLDGRHIGSTPYNDELPAGEYKVRFSKEGYKDAERSVTVEADKIGAARVILEPFLARLSVFSDPPETWVYLDGTLLGTTPLNGVSVPVGPYQLKIVKAGYHDKVSQVQVGPDQTIIVDVMLTRATGSLVVSSDPSEASVYLNEQFVGTTPLKKDELPPGGYTLKLTKDGFKEKVREITIVEGQAVIYDVTF